jgi:anti-anti-sigma factor
MTTTAASTEWLFDTTFRVIVTGQEGTTTVALSGDFDALAVNSFRRSVTIPTDRAEVVFDLSGLEFTDTTGIRELRRIERLLRQVGIGTHLHGANAEIGKMLDVLPA